MVARQTSAPAGMSKKRPPLTPAQKREIEGYKRKSKEKQSAERRFKKYEGASGGGTKPSGKKSGTGIHQSAVKEAPTKVLENELKRRSRTDKGPEKASRWTPAGQAAHKSRGGTK